MHEDLLCHNAIVIIIVIAIEFLNFVLCCILVLWCVNCLHLFYLLLSFHYSLAFVANIFGNEITEEKTVIFGRFRI